MRSRIIFPWHFQHFQHFQYLVHRERRVVSTSLIRAKVEHPFHVVKNTFLHKKTRHKGIQKNDAQLNVLFALSNLYMVRGKLCPYP